MVGSDNGNGKWCGRKMKGDEGLRTVECLRGRLLAERVASRAAKENAEQMGNKLIELENQLSKEIKSRNRAEKRLRFLMMKLEESVQKRNYPLVSQDLEDNGSQTSHCNSIKESLSSRDREREI